MLIEAWEGRAEVGGRHAVVLLALGGAAGPWLPLGAAVAFGSLCGLLGWFAWVGPVRPTLARATIDLAMAGLGAAWWVAA